MSEKFALIIGNTEYIDPGLAQLAAPGRDAEDFARVLNDQDICAFDQVNILLNQLSSTVIEAIDEFFDEKKPDDLLVLYFSGHGVRDELGSLYLAFKNTIRSRLRSTAVKSEYIRDAMDQSRSKRQVVILDCCNSGAFPQGTKAEVGGMMGMVSALQGYGRFVLTASDATQFAWEGDKILGETENSLFTHFLVKGLQGEADLDGDGQISVDELYDYAYGQIARLTPKQTPTKSSSKQEGEIVLRKITRLEDIKPVPLSAALIDSIENPLPEVRLAAVQQMAKLLHGKNLGLARSAREALERIATEDDSRRVAEVATETLESIRQEEQKEGQKAEEDQSIPVSRTGQLRRENMEQAIRFQAEQDKLLREKAELEKRLQEQQIAPEKAQPQRKAKEEAHRLAEQKPEAQPARERAEAQSGSAKVRLKPVGIWGVAILAIVLVGFALTRFRPSLSGPPPTESPSATSAPIKETSTLTDAPIVVPVTAKDTPTPATEVPAATQTPTESSTSTATPYPTEITSKGVPMILVQRGNFTMGSNNGDSDEKPIHTVFLDAYYIDKFEVTNALYEACVDTDACRPPAKADSFTRSSYYGNPQYNDYPVVYVDWNMAKAYCEWREARLPTEAEWEKAARGTEARIYPWGSGLDCQKAKYNRCDDGTSNVGAYESGISPYGVHDMSGNVWEWVADWYSATYYGTSVVNRNPSGPESGQSKVLRGGSWTKSDFDLRASNRLKFAPGSANFDIGFRCANGISP